MNRGRYIVLEGPEGVGKTTQLHELARRLQAAGLPVRVLREPDSQSDLTARAIRHLTQDPHYPMNTRTEVLLYNAARAQSLQVISQSVENGVICLVDRNYLTTLAIQYYGRGDVPDYGTINSIINFAVGGVEPDLCVVLDAPVTTLRERLSNRGSGERFDNLDDAFLERVRAGYLWEARQRDLKVIFATDDKDTVANNIWKLVTDNLAARSPKSTAASSEPASVKEIIGSKELPAHQSAQDKDNELIDVSSEPESQASNANIPEQSTPKPSTTQKNVSYLLAANIKSTRFGASDTQSDDSRYAKSDRDYAYYVPDYFKPSIKSQYIEAMDAIFSLRNVMSEKLKEHTSIGSASDTSADNDDILRSVLPLAAETTVDISGSEESLKNLQIRLLSTDLPESQQIADSLIDHSDENQSSKYRITTAKAVDILAKEYLPDNHAATPAQPVSLVDYWPKNELLLVPDMLYGHSNLSLERLQSVVNDWPYDKKAEVFKTFMGVRNNTEQRPGRALEKAHYSWDIVSDFNTFYDLQNYHIVDAPDWQELTPRYGYEVPKQIEDAGLTDQFEACFDISLKLHSLLQKEGYLLESQYAVLKGHRMRWKLTYNAREAFRIYESDTSTPKAHTATRDLLLGMYEKMAEVHPLLAESMIFAKNDDPSP